jgi:hypothetical protein
MFPTISGQSSNRSFRPRRPGAPATLWGNHGRSVWLNYPVAANTGESGIAFEVEDPDVSQPVSIAVFTACGGAPVACAVSETGDVRLTLNDMQNYAGQNLRILVTFSAHSTTVLFRAHHRSM